MLIDNIDRTTANVYGIYGHLGGGKSLTAVELMLGFLDFGWTVVSNIQLFHLDGRRGRYEFIPDFANVDFWSLPCGAPRGSSDGFRSVVVIDECAEFFDQYSSGSDQVRRFTSWLRHSSKRGQYVFLIVQQPEFIAKSLRLLIHKWIVCVDLRQFRLPFFRVRLPMMSGYVWRRIFDRYGNLISRGWNLGDKALIGYHYDTSQSIALDGRTTDYTPSDKAPQPVSLRRVMIAFVLLYLWLMCFRI